MYVYLIQCACLPLTGCTTVSGGAEGDREASGWEGCEGCEDGEDGEG